MNARPQSAELNPDERVIFTVYLPRSVRQQLRTFALKRGVSASVLVADAIERLLRRPARARKTKAPARRKKGK